MCLPIYAVTLDGMLPGVQECGIIGIKGGVL